MSGRRPSALLFDWDNTLIDSWDAIHHALAVTFRAMEREPWTYEETVQRVRASARDSFPILFGARAEEALEVFYRTFEADHLQKLRARAGAGDMLRELAAEPNLYLAVVSNKKGDLLRREVTHLGWDGLFSRLVGGNDAPRDKPAVESVLLALEGSGLEPGPAIWFVGDTDIDMQCAVNSGCIPVLVRPHSPQEQEFGEAEPKAYFSDCTTLLETVRSL